MNVLALALLFSDAALNASNAADYRLNDDRQARMFADPRSEEGASRRRWTPGVDGWTRERRYCPAFFKGDLGKGSIFRFGPRCDDGELPYAHPVEQKLR